MKKNFNCYKVVLTLFFILLFFYGILTLKHYGISADEPTQRYHSLVTYNELFLKGKTYITETIDTTKLPSLSDYGSNYGIILQLPLVFIEHLFDFTLSYDTIFYIRHIYTFLWFFVAAIYFYKMASLLTTNRLVTFAGLIMFVLSPRIFADSLYNIKDSLCMSLFTISMYYGLRLLQSLHWRDGLLFVIFSALCTTSRIIGGVVVGVTLLLLIIQSVINKTWKKYWKYFFLVVIAFIGGFTLITPKSWGNVLQTLLQTLQTFMNYTIWTGSIYYMGQTISGTVLPWHYLFVWIGITVPTAYWILSCGGLVQICHISIKKVRHKTIDLRFWQYLFLLFLLVIPFCYVLLVRPVLYHGWRHFFFIYPVIVSSSLICLDMLTARIKSKHFQILLWGAISISFFSTGVWMLRHRGYEFLYFNTWIREYAMDSFELDYWYLTEDAHLDYIRQDSLQDGNSSPTTVTDISAPYRRCFSFQSDSLVPQITSDYMQADYVISWSNGFEQQYRFAEVNTILLDNKKISSLYKHIYTPVADFVLINTEDSFYTSLGIITWDIQETDSTVQIVGHLDQSIGTDRFVILLPEDLIPFVDQLQFLISTNGIEWHDLKQIPDYTAVNNMAYAECMVHDVQYIKIQIPNELQWTGELKVRLCQYTNALTQYQPYALSPVENISTNASDSSALLNMIDSEEFSRFTTDTQTPGIYIELELKEQTLLSALQLSVNGASWDIPSDLRIYVSNDKDEWILLEYTTSDGELYYIASSNCKYIRLELGDNNSSDSKWSIHELQLFSQTAHSK